MDLKLRRRAIYTGMSPYFDDDELLAAMQLWQEIYSDKPKFAFTEFLIDCCKTKELKAKRSEILRSIFHAMDLPESMLLEDPLRVVNTKAEMFTTKSSPEPADNTTIIFVSFFESLLNKTHGEETDALRTFVVSQSEKLKIGKVQKSDLISWLNQREQTLSLRYELPIFRQLINFAYVALCEYKGPVKADQLLSQTMREAQEEASALQVNLHDFL